MVKPAPTLRTRRAYPSFEARAPVRPGAAGDRRALLAILYLFAISDYDYLRLVKIELAVGAGYIGIYLPNMLVQNLVQRRQTSITGAFPDACDMRLICMQSGMSIEAAIPEGFSEVGDSRWNWSRSFRVRPPNFLTGRTAGRRSRTSASARVCPASRLWPRPSSRRSATARPLVRRCA